MSPSHETLNDTQPKLGEYGLRVTTYDQAASLLISLLILVGMGVAILTVLVWTARIFSREDTVPIVLEQIGDDGGAMGDSDELDAPEMEETDLEQLAMQDTLASVADAVALKSAMLNNPSFDSESRPGRGGKGGGGGRGTGTGRPGKKRHWEVTFLEGNTIDTYARQLDFFKIELGVVMPGNKVEYASNLSQRQPTRRTGAADAEKRYYLAWRRGGLQEVDIELLRRAGIESNGRLILKFLSPELETQMVGLERAKAGDKADRVVATYFGIEPTSDGYRFYVFDYSLRR